MRAMLLAFVAIGVISYGAYWALHNEVDFSSAEQTSGSSVRLD